MAQIFKQFTANDILPADIQTVSSPVWSGNVNPLTTFYTSSNSSSWEYYVPVYDKNPTSDDTAAVQFSVAYGHRLGSGSAGDSDIVDNTYNTPSKAIYSQYRNLLLPPTQQAFQIGGTSVDDIFVVNINRARIKQKLDPGNWELRLKGSVTTMKLIDGSGAGENPSINEAGRIFNIYSGSGAVTASNTVYGLAYPDLGILIISTAVSESAGFTVTRTTSTAATNSINFVKAISSSAYFAARTEEKVTSNHYFVRITNSEFNYSNNPTFVTGSAGTFKWSAMLRNPQVYLTTIGLYDNSNRLLAVAKLSRPLLKTFNREALIKVKIDY